MPCRRAGRHLHRYTYEKFGTNNGAYIHGCSVACRDPLSTYEALHFQQLFVVHLVQQGGCGFWFARFRCLTSANDQCASLWSLKSSEAGQSVKRVSMHVDGSQGGASSFIRHTGSLHNLRDRNVHASSSFMTTQSCLDQQVCVLTALRESRPTKRMNVSSETND